MQKNGNKNNSPMHSSFISPFHIEIDRTARGVSLSCSGVKGITEFSDSVIRLKLSSFSLEIKGKKLYMTVFEGKCVEIIGRFSEVNFIYGES